MQGLLHIPSPFPGSPLSPVLRIPNPSYHRNNCTRIAIGAEQILGRSSFGRSVHESHPVAAISPLQAPLKQERVLPAEAPVFPHRASLLMNPAPTPNVFLKRSRIKLEYQGTVSSDRSMGPLNDRLLAPHQN